MLERAPFIDEYIEDDRSVVMLADGRVLAVAPVVTAILHVLTQNPCSFDVLVHTMVQTFAERDITWDAQLLERSVRFVIAENLVQETSP